MFTEKEILYMRSLGINVDFNDNSEDTLNDIMDIIENMLTFDEKGNPTGDCMLCEDIITKVTTHPNW